MKTTSLLLFAAWLTACGSSVAPALSGDGSSSNPDGGSGVAADGGAAEGGAASTTTMAAACASYANDYCDTLSACSPLLLLEHFGPESVCVDRTVTRCMSEHDAAAAGASANDVLACGEAWKTAPCGDFINDVRPAACRIPGAIENGGGCASDDDCKSTKCVRHRNAGSACGTCVDPLASGNPCDYFADACSDGLRCPFDVEGPTTCEKAQLLGHEGDPCELGVDCEPHLSCPGGGVGGCTKALQLGDACQGGDTGCDVYAGLNCGVDGTCVVDPEASPGQPCVGDSICTNGAHCDEPSNDCQAPTADGATCGNDVDCVAPAVCALNTSTCVIPTRSVCAK